MIWPRSRCRTACRRGTTAVETAFVLPVFMLFVFALIEFGHAMMVNNVMRSACRAGARLGSTEGNSTQTVESRVRQILSGAVDPDQAAIHIKSAAAFDGGSPPESGGEIEALPDMELANAESGQLFLVRTKVAYNDIAIVPINIPYVGPFLKDIELQGQAFMRHE